MHIVRYPHPALRWKSKPVARIDAALKSTVREMFDLMYTARGIGLAANQVGLPLRMFVVNVTGDAKETDDEVVFINPEITRRKGSGEDEEGCLSLPELYGQVRRPSQIVVSAFDLEGQEFELTLEDMDARVVQHELDHLDGVLFIDRMTDAARQELAPKIADFEVIYRRQQAAGEQLSDADIRKHLLELEKSTAAMI